RPRRRARSPRRSRSAPSAGSRRCCATPYGRAGRCSASPLLLPAVERAYRTLLIQRGLRFGRGIAEDHLDPLYAAALIRSEHVDRLAKGAHAEITLDRGVAAPVEAIQIRGHLEQAGAVLDEVFVDQARAGPGGWDGR